MTFTKPGSRMLQTRSFYVLWSIWTLAIALLIDHFLPSWITVIFMLLEHLGRTLPICREWSRSNFAIVIWCSISIGALWAYLAVGPEQYRLATLRVLLQGAQACSTKANHLRNDGPLNNTSYLWLLHRDSTIVGLVLLIGITRSSSVFGFLFGSVKWFMFPVLCIWLALRIRDQDIAWLSYISRFLLWPVVQLSRTLGESLHWYSFAMAVLYYWLPRHLDRQLSRLGQAARYRHATFKYKYWPLRPGEIRLLQIEPRRWLVGGTVRASLQHVQPSMTLQYDAVSYRWGDPALTEEILVDGHPMAVTQSALQVLLNCRTSWTTKTIWIDAICINQRDGEEKASQIRMMRDIYSNATRVVLYPVLDWYARAAVPTLLQLMANALTLTGHPRQLRKLAIGQKESHRWHAEVDLFLDEYFERVWVVQEIAAGQDVQLYYGGYYINWINFFSAVNQMVDPHCRDLLSVSSSKDKQRFQDSSTFGNIATMFSLWQHKWSSEKRLLPLEFVLICTGKFRASNSKDQVFALLGISDCADVEELQPDYSRPPEEIFTGVSRFLLTTRGTPAVQLVAAAGIGYTDNRRDIPSWAVDRDEWRHNMMLTDAWVSENTFHAAAETSAVVYAGEEYSTMIMQGFLLDDELSKFSPAGALNFGGLQPGDEVASSTFAYYKRTFFRAAVEMVHNHRTYRWNDDNLIDDDLWRTLIANRIDRKLVTDTRWRVVAHAWAYCMAYIDVDDCEGILRFQNIFPRYGLAPETLDWTDVLMYAVFDAAASEDWRSHFHSAWCASAVSGEDGGEKGSVEARRRVVCPRADDGRGHRELCGNKGVDFDLMYDMCIKRFPYSSQTFQAADLDMDCSQSREIRRPVTSFDGFTPVRAAKQVTLPHKEYDKPPAVLSSFDPANGKMPLRYTLNSVRVWFVMAVILVGSTTILSTTGRGASQNNGAVDFRTSSIRLRSPHGIVKRGNTGNDAIPGWLGYNPSELSRPPAQLDVKGRAVKKGHYLACMMRAPVAGVAASIYQSIEDMIKYGWRASFIDRPDDVAFIKELGLTKAFTDLRIPSEGWTQISTGNHVNVFDPNDNSKIIHPASYATYSTEVNLAAGAIVATQSYGPGYMAQFYGVKLQPGQSFTPLQHVSDLLFLSWKKLINDRKGGSLKNLEHMFRWNSHNEDVKALLKIVAGGKDIKQIGEWPGVSYPIHELQALATLSAGNAQGVAWLLGQHKEAMGRKTVAQVNIFNCPALDGEAQWCVYLHIVPVQ
ncbi:hypothetical protein BST61_g49 [Cercospora zeina]